MKKVILAFLLLSLCVPASLYALGNGDQNDCHTKFPIVLAHGMGTQSKVLKLVNYWWGIPRKLQEEGAEVYVTNVNGMDATTKKAAAWKKQVLEILATTGAARINVIAHSHGGLYTRFAISNLELAPVVASLTTIGSPHRGTALIDLFLGLVPNSLEKTVGKALDYAASLFLGDVDGDSIQNEYDLVRANAVHIFNPSTPDMPGVYYQSWATKIKDIRGGGVLLPQWLIMLPFEGANDGMVAVSSAKWGRFRGVITGAWWCGGLNHFNQVNHIYGITPGFDVPGFYTGIVSELREMGY